MIEERERCRALGMNGHLSKPIEPDALYATLARHYARPATAAMAPAQPVPRVQPVPSGIPSVPGLHGALHLPHIAGLDTACGMRHAGHKPALYEQVLAGFARDYAGCGYTLAEWLAGAQWEQAERMAHTLKGLAGTIGASQVQLRAGALEAACKNRQAESAAAALSALASQLAPLLDGLHQHFADRPGMARSAGGAENDSVPPRKLPDCLPQLQRLLGEGDSEAIDLWERHAHEFVHALSPLAVQRIGIALQNFDFDAAHALLAGCAPRRP